MFWLFAFGAVLLLLLALIGDPYSNPPYTFS